MELNVCDIERAHGWRERTHAHLAKVQGGSLRVKHETLTVTRTGKRVAYAPNRSGGGTIVPVRWRGHVWHTMKVLMLRMGMESPLQCQISAG